MGRSVIIWGFVPILLFSLIVSPGSGFGAQDSEARLKSVKPGINDRWISSDIDPLIDILETESREIYRERSNLAALVGPPPGAVIADVGAGSGFMAEEFAALVGDEGIVYAVDINPVMLDDVLRKAKAKGITNIRKVLSPEDSVNLAPNSVDIVFMCDTYHHFEYPKPTMRSIYQALRPGGQLVLVDFKRIPGQSEPWMLEHVRAGEEVFKKEILQVGFELTNSHYPPYLADNYVLRFRKPPVTH
jgi:ubiquinone/menaquinone biosynthesis C-methylase UbiE